MKVAIIQMSDLHIASGIDKIVTNASKLARSVSAIVNTCQKVVVVITGDIIDKGKTDNYAYAKQMLVEFRNEIEKEAKLESWDYVFVPGNHDVDFSMPSDLRNLVVEKCVSTGVLDSEIFTQELLKPQAKFWEFYSEFAGDAATNQISYKKIVPINEQTNIEFHCYNTALFSTIDEKPQSLLMPQSCFLKYEDDTPDRKDLVISVYHHKSSWLTTRDTNNNQRMFSDHIQKTSQILMCGHEHQKDQKTLSDLENKDMVLYLESDSMQQGNTQSFSVITYDDEDNSSVSKYDVVIDSDFGISTSHALELKIPYHSHQISFSKNYLHDLNSICAPIHHPRKSPLLLEDVYVYPDLDPQSNTDDDKVLLYIDSQDLINNSQDGQVIILEGDSQCGKSTLLKMLSMQCYRKAIYPITLYGADIRNIYTNTILENAFKKQYDTKSFRYDQYNQLERKERIVFIDNLDKSALNNQGKDELWKKLLSTFSTVIVTTGQNFDIRNWLNKEKKDFSIAYYCIQPLGHLKRNQLIEKWVLLGLDRYTVDENGLLETVKTLYNQIEGVLGKELLPSNPIFLLTLLQKMDSSIEAFDNAPTSYAALYQSLLYAALMRANVPQDKLSGISAFLSGLSYRMYVNKQETIRYASRDGKDVTYSDYYDAYTSKHVFSYSKEKLRDILKESQVWIEKDSECYMFSYKYLYFYLIAQELSDMIRVGKDGEAKQYIVAMCDSLHKSSNANVLIFLAYLDKSKTLLDEIRFTSLLPFEDLTPITLKRDDVLYQELEQLVTQLKDDVLKSNVDPHKHRESGLKKQDEEVRAIKKAANNATITPEDLDHNTDLRDYINSLLVTRIIGQIIKNQRDTLEIDDLSALIEDAYITTFRSVSFITKMIEDDYQEFVKEFTENKDRYKSVDVDVLKNKISRLLQSLLLRMSLMSFSNLSLSVGTSGKEMMDIYDTVAKKIGSPAADFISFTIKTYYGSMKEDDLKNIVKRYKDSPVMLRLINARVRSYVYQHNLEYNKLSMISSVTGMKLIDSPFKQIALRNR